MCIEPYSHCWKCPDCGAHGLTYDFMSVNCHVCGKKEITPQPMVHRGPGAEEAGRRFKKY